MIKITKVSSYTKHKKMTFKSIYITLLFLFLGTFLYGQKFPMKFGKIKKEDLEMTVYDQDSSAHAVILDDFGYSEFKYDVSGDKGFYLNFYRHVRIKILDQRGLEEWSDFKFFLYNSGRGKEKIVGLKAYTHNMENGKMVKKKLSSKQVFEEEHSKNYDVLQFAMPEVKVGSILEVKYNLLSDFLFNLQQWKFQSTIPTRRSEYRTDIPEYFNYNKTLKGYEMDKMVVNESREKPEKFNYKVARRGVGQPARIEEVNYTSNFSRWVVENMPAFKSEAYMTSKQNFLTAMTFELSWIKYPQSSIDHYTLDWKAINTRFLGSSYFGENLKKRKLIKEDAAQISEKYTTPEEKMLAVHNFVKTKVKWNKRMTSGTRYMKKSYEKGKGTSADINLLLILMLKEVGLEVKPVCLSTRSHGYINPAHPTESQLNYVIARVTIGENDYLLDATDPLLPASLLPERCFNGQGRLIQKGQGNWIPIEPLAGKKETIQVNVEIQEEGQLTGVLKTVRKDYSAYYFRKRKKEKGDDAGYTKYLEEKYEGLEVKEYSCENENDLSKDIREEYSIEISDQINANGDFIYLNPLLLWSTTENPFKMEDRKYPIDYGVPINNKIAVKYMIPEGYQVEELPEISIVALPEKAAKYTFHVTKTEEAIQIVSKFQINRTIFTYEDYKALQEFYNLIIQKNSEQIVLRKI